MADSTNNRSLLSRLHYDMAIAEADEHRVKMERVGALNSLQITLVSYAYIGIAACHEVHVNCLQLEEKLE